MSQKTLKFIKELPIRINPTESKATFFITSFGHFSSVLNLAFSTCLEGHAFEVKISGPKKMAQNLCEQYRLTFGRVNNLSYLWIAPSSFIFLLILLSGCQRFREPKEYKVASAAATERDFILAETNYKATLLRLPDSKYAVLAAREGAKISFYETKNYPLAVEFFKHLVLYSDDGKERLDSQQKIAEIYFYHLSDYAKALIEYQRILDVVKTEPEKIKNRFQLARCQFYLNSLPQALAEIDELLKGNVDDSQKFDVLLLKANITLAMKNPDGAIALFKELLEMNPARSKEENVMFNLAVAYEDLQQFDRSIQILQDLKVESKNPEFLDMRIRRLHRRRANLPGGRGYKR